MYRRTQRIRRISRLETISPKNELKCAGALHNQTRASVIKTRCDRDDKPAARGRVAGTLNAFSILLFVHKYVIFR